MLADSTNAALYDYGDLGTSRSRAAEGDIIRPVVHEKGGTRVVLAMSAWVKLRPIGTFRETSARAP
jgi:hypothetical protein